MEIWCRIGPRVEFMACQNFGDSHSDCSIIWGSTVGARLIMETATWIPTFGVQGLQFRFTGLLLRNFKYITLMRKPYYLLDIHSMVA